MNANCAVNIYIIYMYTTCICIHHIHIYFFIPCICSYCGDALHIQKSKNMQQGEKQNKKRDEALHSALAVAGSATSMQSMCSKKNFQQQKHKCFGS